MGQDVGHAEHLTCTEVMAANMWVIFFLGSIRKPGPVIA
jgi:hypothetical protein